MKDINWLGVALAFGLVLLSISAPERATAFKHGNPPTHSGRPLTPTETAVLETAIVNIFVPPPDSLKYADENGDSHTVSCQTIGLDLLDQLTEGHVEAETLAKGSSWTLPDSSGSTYADQLNIDPVRVANAQGNPQEMRTLEGILVHEWMHKTQDTASLRNNDESEELAPYSIMAAYYCSTAVVPGDVNDHNTKWALNEEKRRRPPPVPPQNPHQIRPFDTRRIGRYFTFLNCDTAAVDPRDTLMAFSSVDPVWHNFPLYPMRGSDLLIVEDSPMLPPDHTLIAVCGGFPATGVARILLLDFFEGEVIAPVWNHDFGPPSGDPPMFFYSVTKQQPDGPWFVLDSLNHRILLMEDSQYSDDVPDEIISEFASAGVPGMECIAEAQGLEAVSHPFMGPGVMVLEEGVHMHDSYYLHDWNCFLTDTDGNLVADAAAVLPLYEFLAFTPLIHFPHPWPGDSWVNLYASWEHDIAVWSTDETGEILYEQLGLVHMSGGVGMDCMLLRELELNEYIMPVDMQTGKHALPVQVIDPTPYEITLNFDSNDGMLKVYYGNGLNSCHYELWSSDDGEDFYNTGLTSEDGCFEIALPPQDMQFYYIKAVR